MANDPEIGCIVAILAVAITWFGGGFLVTLLLGILANASHSPNVALGYWTCVLLTGISTILVNLFRSRAT